MATRTFKLTNVLGVGSYGMVFSAIETSQGTAVAVKKSRVSLRVKRTLLHYEARVMQVLQGHPAIPSLHGYGRFAHFEYLAMDLCNESIKALAPQPHGTQLKTVIIIAQQMISALQHIHSCGIVHRDIKPDNVLVSLQDPSRIVLVDYGISCPRYQGPALHRYNPEAEHRQVTGTIKWASLNAHHGIHLSWRDDLESLAYVLIFLLRGNLPWQDTRKHDTLFGATAQMRMSKTKWSGSRLAYGHPAEFGQFLDKTRALGFDDVPPYTQYLDMFHDLYSRSGFDNSDKTLDWSPAMRSDRPTTKSSHDIKSPAPLVPGQLVSIEFLAAPTILGIMPDDELWDLDQSYSAPSTQALPAAVLRCTTTRNEAQHVTLAALKRGTAPRFGRSVHITSIGYDANDVQTIPPWPFDDTYCYVFPTVMSCVAVENTAQSINYRIHEQGLEILERQFGGDDPLDTQTLEEGDKQAFASMKSHNDNFPILVRVAPLDPGNKAVDWTSERAWFDQIVSIRKRRAADDGWPWTGVTEDAEGDDGGDLSNSYRGADIADWDNMQQERDKTLTFADFPQRLALTELDAAIPHIENILDAY